VQQQVEETLADHIIEESHSAYVNPLTLLQQDGKRIRMCLNAREANKFMMLDLSSAFCKPLEESSRTWVAFQF
jgi:hypothetical protein